MIVFLPVFKRVVLKHLILFIIPNSNCLYAVVVAAAVIVAITVVTNAQNRQTGGYPRSIEQMNAR